MATNLSGGPELEPELGKYPQSTLLLAQIAAVVIAMLGLVSNIVTVAALFHAKKLWNTTMPFIVSLNISGVAFCLTVMPILIVRYITKEWGLWTDALCKIYPFFLYGTTGTSMLNLTFITVSQYFLVLHSGINHKVFSRKNIALMLACAWLLPSSLLLLPLTGVWGAIGYDKERYSCTFLGKSGKVFQHCLHFFGFIIPCLIIAACYTRIFIVYRRSRRQFQQKDYQSPASTSACSAKRRLRGKTESTRSRRITHRYDVRLAATMLVTFLAFLVSFLPFTIVRAVDPKISVSHPTIYVICAILAWLNCCLNPFIYVILNKRFRDAYKNRLGCTMTRHSDKSPVTNGETLNVEAAVNLSTESV